MRLIYLLIFVVVVGFSCNTQTNNKSKVQTDSMDSKLVPDSSIALQFINDYSDFCSKKQSSDNDWIKKNRLLTDNFKTAYKNLLDSAIKLDPEMGLGFDPIFDAQDYPDQGFEIVSCDNKSGFVTLKGKDWPEFVLIIRIVYQDNKWLVDGSGVINIPENERAKR
jgi:hypothetical protein